MGKKRVFTQKPLKDKTAKVGQNKFKKNKVNNKQNIFNKKSSNVVENFFVTSSDKKNIEDDQSTSESFKPSRQSVSEGQFKVEKNQKQVMEKNDDVKETKKPFDKKLYRLKKYSNKYKLEQWEEKRKQSILREFHKSIKNEKTPKFDVAKIYEEEEEETSVPNKELSENNDDNSKSEKPKTKKSFLKPHERFQKIKEEKQKKREEMMKRQAEREKAIKEANKQRYERNKKLSRKTKKGQPIMRYRMEMLLEKIEKSLKN